MAYYYAPSTSIAYSTAAVVAPAVTSCATHVTPVQHSVVTNVVEPVVRQVVTNVVDHVVRPVVSTYVEPVVSRSCSTTTVARGAYYF